MKGIDKQLDDAWSRVSKSKVDSCEYSGTPYGLVTHHIFKRSHMNTRWDLDNAIVLNERWHTSDPNFSAHRTPKKFRDWLIKTRGIDWYNKLEHKKNETKLWTLQEKKELLKSLLQSG